MSEFDEACASAAAPHAPRDLAGLTADELEQRLDDEGDRAADVRDDREREMALAEHEARWRAYLLAWHAEADRRA
jgi:hypothetical protein